MDCEAFFQWRGCVSRELLGWIAWLWILAPPGREGDREGDEGREKAGRENGGDKGGRKNGERMELKKGERENRGRE